MRILYLVPDLFGPPGGIARYSRLVAKALSESEAVKRLDVIALLDAPGVPADPRYLASDRFSYRAAAGSRSMVTRMALASMAARPYDILLSGHINLTMLFFAPIPRQRWSRRISIIYGTDAWDPLPWHRQLALRSSDTVLAISRYTAQRAAQANALSLARLKVLHNCLDPTLESSQAEPGRDLRPVLPNVTGPVLLTVSRLWKVESGKGHHTVLRALPQVLQRIPEVHYIIVGEGDLRPELERLAIQLGVAHRTHFLGALSDEEVGRVFESSDVYVMPSKYEGFGFVFLEAMAHGLPIVAGNRDATSEVVADAGLLVDPDDVGQVGAAVVRVLSDAGLRRELSRAGSRRLDKLFRYDRFRNTLLKYVSTDTERWAHPRIW